MKDKLGMCISIGKCSTEGAMVPTGPLVRVCRCEPLVAGVGVGVGCGIRARVRVRWQEVERLVYLAMDLDPGLTIQS